MYSVSDETRKPIFEGVQGENEAREIQFDVTAWVEELGEGVCTATAKRPTDATPYPVTVTRSGNVVTWKPNSVDTAIEGVGAFQLEYSINDSIAKTRIWNTKIAPSLDPAGDPPDPYDNWLAEMRQIAADALQDAQDADASAQDAEAWAKGTKNGTPVPSTADQYENNAKYYAEQSAENQYGAYIVKSASGDIASFNDGGDDIPMKSLKVTITPKQAGSGDPSPDNVRPISGTSTANVFITGKNLFGGEYAVKYDLFIPAGQAVTVSAHKTGSANLFFAVYDKSGSVIDYWTVTGTSGTRNYRTFTFAYDVYGVRFYNSASDDMQIELGSTPTDYIPYTGHTTPVPLGQTVYGGTVDVTTGILTITKGGVVYNGSENWGAETQGGTTSFYIARQSDAQPVAQIQDGDVFTSICPVTIETWQAGKMRVTSGYYNFLLGSALGISTAAQFKTYLASNPISLCYKLATPTTVQLTPTQVATLLGTNNVWADCGSVEVEYRADPTLAYNELANVIVSLGGNL